MKDALLQFAHIRQPNPGLLALNLDGPNKAFGAEVAGLLGYPLMQYFTLAINYRDGLVDFIYESAIVR